MTNIIPFSKSAQSLNSLRFLHPREISDELSTRLVAKMEALAHEAYLEGRRRGFSEGWFNGATVVLAASLVALATAFATT